VPPQRTHFDLQAHRGGIGMTTEESLQGFAKALRLGVSTLELDTQITKDEKVVVNHDRQISAQKCRDTAPVTAGDPVYPYVGKYIKDLTLAQIKTMDCGYQLLPGFPEQEQVKGFRMVELKDVLGLVRSYRAHQVKLNIETKVEAGNPEQTDADGDDGDFVKAAAAVPGVTALSPNYGFPQDGKVNDPGFRFYPDAAMVSEAHARGLTVIPWTCDDPATVTRLMDMGGGRHHHELPQPGPADHGRPRHAAAEGLRAPLARRARAGLGRPGRRAAYSLS
jgi:glycerophosphoryl diester phosphodiesterase